MKFLNINNLKFNLKGYIEYRSAIFDDKIKMSKKKNDNIKKI